MHIRLNKIKEIISDYSECLRGICILVIAVIVAIVLEIHGNYRSYGLSYSAYDYIVKVLIVMFFFTLFTYAILLLFSMNIKASNSDIQTGKSDSNKGKA